MFDLDLLDRVNETTATTGTGTVTLSGTRVSEYQTWASGGAVNGRQYPYLIKDGSDSEWGWGTYTSSGTTFSRDLVVGSIISGVSGTTKITLSGSATVACSDIAASIGPARLAYVKTTAGQTSFTLMSSIPQTYRKLRIDAKAGSASSSTSLTDGWAMQFNGSSSNYNSIGVGFYSGGVFNTGTISNMLMAGLLPSTGVSGVVKGVGVAQIINYNVVDSQSALTNSEGWQNNTSILMMQAGGQWTPATPAAITQIDIVQQSGRAFTTGSEFWLFGEW